MPVTWECAQCHRRVPMALQECRCGAFRPQPDAPARLRMPDGPDDIAGPRFSWRELPRPVVVALGVIVVSTLAVLVSMFVYPPAPPPLMPLLGYMDRPAPTPPPTTVPTLPQSTPQPPPPTEPPPPTAAPQ
jgi:hypothetical protein